MQNYLKICQIVWEGNIFKVFSKANLRPTALLPGSHILRSINMAWWNLIESHLSNISTKLFVALLSDGHFFQPINMA